MLLLYRSRLLQYTTVEDRQMRTVEKMRSHHFNKKMRALASIPGNEKPEVVNKMRTLPSIFSGAGANLETSRSEVGEVVSPFSPAA